MPCMTRAGRGSSGGLSLPHPAAPRRDAKLARSPTRFPYRPSGTHLHSSYPMPRPRWELHVATSSVCSDLSSLFDPWYWPGAPSPYLNSVSTSRNDPAPSSPRRATGNSVAGPHLQHVKYPSSPLSSLSCLYQSSSLGKKPSSFK